MNLFNWDHSVELKEISKRFKSCLRAISISRLDRSRDVDYAGLNAALRRYEHDRHSRLNQAREGQAHGD